ncbi:lipase family protein [Nocardioides antri]|uniref:Fungal lipase-type domain-containing protein n=1 Tax=Nocardioides antri TaxID=2607659 RepID=A0A5B1M6B2_9ACTN|nr:hypothetical protein [Nocardioides antri]KAA1427220.1 hypothetical protein F0U47_06865 [Nocardioides antri]
MTGSEYDVHGGAHGVEADMDDMDAVGGTIRSTGFEIVEVAGASHAFLVDGNLLESAVLSPGTFATFEAEMIAALDGPHALAAHGLSMSAAGIFMQGMAKAYAFTDRAVQISDDIGDWAQGYTLPLQLGWKLSPAGLPATVLDLAELADEGLFSDPAKWLVEHPDQLEELVASSPGFVALLSTLAPSWASPLVGFPLDVEQASSTLAGLYNQELEGLTAAETYASQSPSDIEGALTRLDEVANHDDQFQVEVVDGVYNVYLPGTKAFDAPFDESGLVQNMGTNFAAVAGDDNAYQQAVLEALADVPPGAEINFIGHSQGGIVAARLAEAIANGETDVQGNVNAVLTAGSPVDDIELPEDVQMVSLVNEYDIVPRLDGEAYGDKSNHTSIVFEEQNGETTANHSLAEVYVTQAGEIVASDDAAVVDALAGLGSFGGGGDSTVTTYQMVRG